MKRSIAVLFALLVVTAAYAEPVSTVLAQASFRMYGFTLEDAPLHDGTPRALGTHPTGVLVEYYASDGLIYKVYVAASIAESSAHLDAFGNAIGIATALFSGDDVLSWLLPSLALVYGQSQTDKAKRTLTNYRDGLAYTMTSHYDLPFQSITVEYAR